MGGIAADQAWLARCRRGQQVAADVTRRHAHGAAAGDHDVGKVLAHTFAQLQRFQRRCTHLGAFAVIDHAGVDAFHQVLRCFGQGPPGGEAGSGEFRKRLVARNVGRGEQEFAGTVIGGAGAVAELLTHLLPGQACRRVFGRCGERQGGDDAVGDHRQLVVRRVQREISAGVAVHVGPFLQPCRLRADRQLVAQQLLAGVAGRLEVQHMVGTFDGGAVRITRFMNKVKQHGGRKGRHQALRRPGCVRPGPRG